MAIQKACTLVKVETNPSAYNKIYKEHLEKKGKIHCAYCPYHKRENVTRPASHKSWKEVRRTKYRSLKTK